MNPLARQRGKPLSVDLGLRLLELTVESRAVKPEELKLQKSVVDAKLGPFTELGLLKITHGLLRMSGRQRIMLAEKLIHGGVDPRKASRFLAWQEFEDFAEDILRENAFATCKHLVFRSEVGRREIDILAWNDTFTLATDCKHWRSGLSPGRIRNAAQAQTERTVALSHKPELLHRLRIPNPESRRIIPVILSLGEPQVRIIDGVPVVCISKLLSFIYGVSPIDDKLRFIRVSNRCLQSRLA